MAKTYFTEISIGRPGFLGAGEWNLNNLTGITIIFGKNGSGKSILLRALRDQDAALSHYIPPERGGGLSFEPALFRDELDANIRRNSTSTNQLRNYRNRIISRIQSYFSVRGNDRTGKTPGNPDELEELLSQLVSDFEIKLDGETDPPYFLSRLSDPNPNKITDESVLSSGEAQLITLALDALTISALWDLKKTKKRLLLIDEPDVHIHPDLQVRFADFLTKVATKFDLQCVVATHSTTLLAALGQFGADAVSVIYLDRSSDNFSAIPFSDHLKEISACLGGHALMGPLFGVPILLVEGDDDYRIWSQVPRHHIAKFAVIPSDGAQELKKYQNALERIFESLRNDSDPPAGYALLDGDVAMPQPNPDRPQKHIPFRQLACRESENLYLCDEVLADLGSNWEDAVGLFIETADQYGDKADQLREAATWDRQEADLKNVIGQISEILDPKKLHWTVRVGSAIGKTRPSGQILNFLGEELVDALWGPLESVNEDDAINTESGEVI